VSGPLDKSFGGTRLVWYLPLESGESFWKLVISLDKSGKNLEKGFWMVKHLILSPNFFDVSLLIVRLSYDLNKI
jgi:hypothetical protein